MKELIKKIEEGLHSLHAQQREGLGLTKPNELDELTEDDVPFAKIGTVTEQSPADKAVCTKVTFSVECLIMHIFPGIKM